MILPGKPLSVVKLHQTVDYWYGTCLAFPKEPIDRLELSDGIGGGAWFILADVDTMHFASSPLDIYAGTGEVKAKHLTGIAGAYIGYGLCLPGAGLLDMEVPALIYGYTDLSGCHLDQATIDGVLAALVAGEGTDMVAELSGGTNAEPSAAGWTSYDTLVSRNWMVMVNGEHP
jgi:hypothetical protein